LSTTGPCFKHAEKHDGRNRQPTIQPSFVKQRINKNEPNKKSVMGRAAGDASTMREAITLKLFEMALNGDFQAIKLLQERSEGRPNTTPDLGRDKTELEVALEESFR